MVGKILITFCCLSISCSSFSRNTLRSMICGIQEQPLHLRSLSGFSNLSRPELRCNVMCYYYLLTWWSNLARPTARTALWSTTSNGSVGSLVGGLARFYNQRKRKLK
jgi:hypothetical protein